jgi:mannose-6-phosphate isomerase
MSELSLYPMFFEPIFQYRPWGGQQLAELFNEPLNDKEFTGEAWLLSDREDHDSHVANGPLKGQTISQLFKHWPDQLMGTQAGRFNRFPLLLKFLDAHEMLSVQVHPSDRQKNYLPPGEQGKTEAWVVLKSGTESLIYAGLKPGTTEEIFRRSVTNGSVADHLASFVPKAGDAILLPAGVVHSLGGDTLVFEVQQNSDVTFRLYDWDYIDSKTGKPRALQVDQALACMNFTQGAIIPATPVMKTIVPVECEQLIQCEHFLLWRLRGQSPFNVGAIDTPRVLVCIEGNGELEHDGMMYEVGRGDVLLLPAVAGVCAFHPESSVTILEIAIPE